MRNNKKRIKNRAVRRVLRQVANWDKCPTDYRKDFKKQAQNIAVAVCGTSGIIYLLMGMAIYFCR